MCYLLRNVQACPDQALEHHCSVELSGKVLYLRSPVATCGRHDSGTLKSYLILTHLNLNSRLCLVATILDRAALSFSEIGQSTFIESPLTNQDSETNPYDCSMDTPLRIKSLININ